MIRSIKKSIDSDHGIYRDHAHNLDVTARMLLYGESRFLSVCDFKRLGVAKRSPTTTFTLEA